eukprot:scaffold215097_cov23-Tisochrysis_lutea.AAC.2
MARRSEGREWIYRRMNRQSFDKAQKRAGRKYRRGNRGCRRGNTYHREYRRRRGNQTKKK